MPPAALQQPEEDLSLIGEALKTRTGDVLSETVARTAESGHDVDAVVQDSFERICTSSTIAVARWIAGESLEVAIEAGRETWEIFGELAVCRSALSADRHPLDVDATEAFLRDWAENVTPALAQAPTPTTRRP